MPMNVTLTPALQKSDGSLAAAALLGCGLALTTTVAIAEIQAEIQEPVEPPTKCM